MLMLASQLLIRSRFSLLFHLFSFAFFFFSAFVSFNFRLLICCCIDTEKKRNILLRFELHESEENLTHFIFFYSLMNFYFDLETFFGGTVEDERGDHFNN
jgi:hypothetical protein